MLATLAILGAALLIAVVAAALLLPLIPEGPEGPGLAAMAVGQVAAVILTLAASSLLGGRASETLSLAAGASFAAYAGGVLCLAALNLVVAIVQYVLIPDQMFTDLRPFVGLLTGPNWVLALFVMGVGAPLSEELLFRGFLLSALAKSRFGFAGGALISTALWTALHTGYSAAGIAEVFLIGIVFCWLLWRTGSLWVAIFCHALYNTGIALVLRHVPLPG